MTELLTESVQWSATEKIMVHFVPATDKVPPMFFRFVEENDRLGFDVESGGPDPLDPLSPGFVVRLVGFATASIAWVLAAEHVEAVRATLRTDRVTFVAHNAPFDTLAVKVHFGVTPANVLDTLAAAVLVYPPDSPDTLDDEHADEVPLDDRHQLKPLSIVAGSRCLVDAEDALYARFAGLLGPRPPGSDQASGVKAWTGRGFTEIDQDDLRYWVYNGLDAVAGLRVLRRLVELWPGARDDFLRLLEAESRLGHMLVGLRWRGQRIDRAALRRVYALGRASQDAMLPGFAEVGVTKPGSAPVVSAALESLGVIEPERSGKTGLISTDKKFGLPRLLEPDQPEPVRALAGKLREWRGHTALVQKIREIDRLLAVYGDGRIHPRVNPQQAKTSRMSISGPALQNIPKKDTRIRSVFISDPGWVLVSADFAQIEYRVAAGLSGDPALIAAVSSGNLHKSTAAAIFGDAFTGADEDSPEWLVMYGYAKNCGFLSLYGGGASNLVGTSGGVLSLSQAERILGKFHAAYPELRKWSARVNQQMEVVTRSGRLLAVDRDRLYANTNYHVQSAARDVFADALLKLRTAGWGDHLWLVIHDEMILHVPADRAEAACAALETAMRGTWFGVPIEAEAEIRGERWMALPETPEAVSDAA